MSNPDPDRHDGVPDDETGYLEEKTPPDVDQDIPPTPNEERTAIAGEGLDVGLPATSADELP